MVELRKRKAPAEAAGDATAAKKSNPVKPAGAKAKDAVTGGQDGSTAAANGTSSSNGKLTVGESITLEGFGGEVETNDGEKTTLQKLVGESKGGVVLFTYPKASTPGCMLSLPQTTTCAWQHYSKISIAPQRTSGPSKISIESESGHCR